MKKDQYIEPKSSFLGMDKDTAIIIKKMLSNQNLLKLLYNYPGKDENGNPIEYPKYWKDYPEVTGEQIEEIINNHQIWHIPKIEIDENFLSFIRITHDDFSLNMANPYYRDNIVEIKIICHLSKWDLGNYELRPYKIAGEIDSMLDRCHLTGIGQLFFLNANQVVHEDEYGGITLHYLAIRGHEDNINPVTG